MTTKFAGVRQLFSGKGASSPPEDDHEDDGAEASTTTGPTQSQVNAVVAEESDKARRAESDRWSKVMSSDEGARNPKAAAKLLTMANGASSADEVIAALADVGAPAASADQGAAQRERQMQLDQDKQALENDEKANPDTGASAGRPGVRTGEGEEGDRAARRQSRAQRIAKRNPKPKG